MIDPRSNRKATLTVIDIGPRVVGFDGVLGRVKHGEPVHDMGAELRVNLRWRIFALAASERVNRQSYLSSQIRALRSSLN